MVTLPLFARRRPQCSFPIRAIRRSELEASSRRPRRPAAARLLCSAAPRARPPARSSQSELAPPSPLLTPASLRRLLLVCSAPPRLHLLGNLLGCCSRLARRPRSAVRKSSRVADRPTGDSGTVGRRSAHSRPGTASRPPPPAHAPAAPPSPIWSSAVGSSALCCSLLSARLLLVLSCTVYVIIQLSWTKVKLMPYTGF